MDPHSITGQSSASSLETEPRFPGEDGGQSLANMAQRDLEAALQLLAERAQYITGASGAAIALRRGEHSDMLCRASAGSNAPELGALLSMEFGLSGESVRTRQALRCDDTETDPRVNREGCRQLGIASVVVMPIVSEQRVLGVFELFSGKPRAFEERDLLALQRLGEMVETAVKHAEATQNMPALLESAGVEGQPEVAVAESLPVESLPLESAAASADLTPVVKQPVVKQKDTSPPEPGETAPKRTELEEVKAEPVEKKPLFWSAGLQTQPGVGRAEEIGKAIPVPAELRNLQKCKACGFPVSQGRTFCVECEEKQWRGQRVPQVAAAAAPVTHPQEPRVVVPAVVVPAVVVAAEDAPAISVQKDLSAAPSSSSSSEAVEPSAVDLATAVPALEDLPASVPEDRPGGDSALFTGSGARSESWFAANKYILGALLMVAIVIVAIAWLR